MLDGVARQFRHAAQIEFLHQIASMSDHGGGCDSETLGDFRRCQSLSDEDENFALACAERRGIGPAIAVLVGGLRGIIVEIAGFLNQQFDFSEQLGAFLGQALAVGNVVHDRDELADRAIARQNGSDGQRLVVQSALFATIDDLAAP